MAYCTTSTHHGTNTFEVSGNVINVPCVTHVVHYYVNLQSRVANSEGCNGGKAGPVDRKGTRNKLLKHNLSYI